jgi:hypothetical protein
VSVAAGPKTVIGGLVFALDARNVKTYDEIPGFTDHGISDWYCFESCTALYSAIYPGTEIVEIDTNGNEVVILTTSSTQPQRGTFNAVGGRRYYGTKAIHLLGYTVGDSQHRIVPVSFAGTSFANFMPGGRGTIQTYYAYSPQGNATISFYNNSSIGINGIATATSVVSKGSTAVFTSTSQNTWQYFKSDKPIIMSVSGEGWDRSILSPAANYSYNRFVSYYNSVTNSGTYTVSGGVVYSNTEQLVVNQTIADGAGGDQAQGIGTAWMSNTYSWGDVLSDYTIIAPYPNTSVNVSYYSGGNWITLENHSLNGSLTSPGVQARDGTTGVGIPANNLSGTAANFASNANLWKFEGNNSFGLVINDVHDDEERLLGWMSNKYLRTSSNVTQSFVNLIDKEDRSRMKLYGKDLTTTIEYAGAKLSASDYFEFDGVDDYSLISLNNPGGDWIHSIEFWMNMNQNQSAISARQDPFQIGTPSTSRYSAVDISNNNFNWYFYSNDCRVTTNLFVANTWYHIGLTYTGGGATSANKQLYVNGANVPFNTSGSANLDIPANSTLSIGRDHGRTSAYFNGKIANFKIYNRALTSLEVQQNYEALRGRFGLT